MVMDKSAAIMTIEIIKTLMRNEGAKEKVLSVLDASDEAVYDLLDELERTLSDEC